MGHDAAHGQVAAVKTIDAPRRPDAAVVAESATRVLSHVVDLQIVLDRCDDAQGAVTTTAAWLADHLGARRVLVGFAPDPAGPCRYAAAVQNDLRDQDQGDDRLSPIEEAAIEEVMLRGETIVVPPQSPIDRFCALAVGHLADHVDAESLLGVPLHDELDVVRGAIILIDAPEEDEGVSLRNQFVALSTPLAEKWLRIHDRQPDRFTRFGRQIGRFVGLTKSWIAISLCVVVCLLLTVPMTYRIRCTCELQPIGKRYLVAPVDGPLESATVHAGDRVSAGEVLAIMNASEIDLQLAALQAELERSRKTADSYLAENRAGETQLAELEARRFELESDLLRHRRKQLELRSPIDGVVLSGDLRDSAGAPLSRGQQLLEIAALGRQRVEIAVPQSEIAFVAADQTLIFQLHAFPDRQFDAKVRRVRPSAEVRDGANVFIAEATIDDPEHLMRPGMKGRAWVCSGQASLGWVLFHRPIARLRVWMGW